MKKILASLPLLCAIFAHTAAHAQNWTWNGAVSSNWSDMGNWTNTASQSNPTLNAFTNTPLQTLRLVAGPNLPSNQDIDGVSIQSLQYDLPGISPRLVIGGKPFTINQNIFQATMDNPGGIETVISNNITFNAPGAGWTVWHALHFHGTLSENAPLNIYKNGNGGIHFHKPLLVSGGLSNAQGPYHFYGMKTTGVAPQTPNPAYFTGSGGFVFNPPPNGPEYIYDFPLEKGVRSPFAATVAAGVEVLINAPVDSNGVNGVTYAGDGILELAAATNGFTGHLSNDGYYLFIVKGGLAPGATNAPAIGPNTGTQQAALHSSTYGAIEFDGVDVMDRTLGVYGNADRQFDGTFRNQNPDRESRFNGEVIGTGTIANGVRVFGGVGDIRHTGDITGRQGGTGFAKAGTGTLTLAGTRTSQTPTTVGCGTLVLDYSATNSNKLAERFDLNLAGTLDLRGNAFNHTVQTIRDLNLFHGGLVGHARVFVAGRGGNSAALRFSNMVFTTDYLDVTTLDFAPGKTGFILASNTVNNAHLGTLAPRTTFNGETFARVAAAQDPDGYRKIEGLPDAAYSNTLIGVSSASFVDLPAGPTVHSAYAQAAALRFNSPGAATLTLNAHLLLSGESPNNYQKGAILVTTNVGPHTVSINGPMPVNDANNNGMIYIHQYNTEPLVVNAQLFRNQGAFLVKTGPGELVVTHTNNTFRGLYVWEGVLTSAAIDNFTKPSPVGSGHESGTFYPIWLGNATLRYAGVKPEGHSSNRNITLRGNGILDASGEGPLRFTHPTPVAPEGNQHNKLLTLGGSGEGVIEGRLDLRGGRLRKRGGGTWTLEDTSHSAAVWGCDVLEGRLVLDGSFGRDVRVFTNGTLSGSGKVNRDLRVHDGGTLDLNPAAVLNVGMNCHIAEGAKLILPKNLPGGEFVPVLKIGGRFVGKFKNPPHYAYLEYAYENGKGELRAKFRPTGTLLMVR